MIKRHPFLVLIIITTLILAFLFWQQANWWVYVEDDPEPILKFEIPLWIQILLSTIVGFIGAGLLAGLVSLILKPGRHVGKQKGAGTNGICG